jgi:two-component system chemotaxis sensor kinase CheA
MDVVKRSIEALRGTIDEASGAKAAMTLHLPLTLAIIECMLVRVGEGRYASRCPWWRNASNCPPRSRIERAAQLPRRARRSGAICACATVSPPIIPPTCSRRSSSWSRARPRRVGGGPDHRQQDRHQGLSRFHAGLGSFSGAILGDGSVALILDVAT